MDSVLLRKPKTYPFRIDFEDGKDSLSVDIRSMTIADEMWWVDRLGGRDPIEEVAKTGDSSDFLALFLHQLDEAPRCTLLKRLGVDDGDIDKGVEALKKTEAAALNGIYYVVMQMRSDTMPDPKDFPENERKKKLRLWTMLTIMWSLLCGFLGWAVKHWSLF